MIDNHDGQFDLIPVTEGVHSDLGWYEAVCIRCDERSGNNAEPFTEDWVENHTCTEFDEIQKPRHYNSHPSGIQAIEIGRHLTGDWFNVFKYVFRANLKNGRQDIDKALWYARDGFEHRIPIQLPSWGEQQGDDIRSIIINETDEHRRLFFSAIAVNNKAWALAEVELILESWPE